MDEELLRLLEQSTQALSGEQTGEVRAQAPGRPELPQARLNTEQPEQELTPELRRKVPVVNRARESGRGRRLQGITNFLENPEAQNALLQFGRAFAQNNPNEAGTILANAGEGIIQGQAEQRALEAFESGDDIASAAGRFARPELVGELQTRAEERRARAERLGLDERQFIQRQEEFAQKIDLQERQQELREMNAGQDFLLRQAAMDADAEEFERLFELRKRQTVAEESVAEARSELMSQQAEFVGDPGGNQAALAAQTNRYVEALNDQQITLQERKNILEQKLNSVSGIDFRGFDEEGNPDFRGDPRGPNFLRSDEAAREAAQSSESIREAQQLASELKRTNQQLESVASEQEFYSQLQRQRLAGRGGEGDTPEEGAQEEDTNQPVGTPESPVEATSEQDALSKPPGSYVRLLGQTVRITERGTFIPVQDNDQ